MSRYEDASWWDDGQAIVGADVGRTGRRTDDPWSWFNEQQNIEAGWKSDDERFGPEGFSEDYKYLDLVNPFWNEVRDAEGNLVEGRSLTAEQLDTYETWYIDEMYDTTNRVWHGRDPSGSDIDQSTGARVHWGTDLVRVAYDREEPTNTDRRHYEWITRGEVDWAHYRNSTIYQNAWASLASDDGYRTQSGEGTWDSDEYYKLWEHRRSTDVDRVSFIREVNRKIASGELDAEGNTSDDDFWTTWDNEYTSTYIHRSHVGTTIQVPGIDGPVDVEVTEDMVGTARDPSRAYTYEPTSLFTAASMEERVTARLNAMETQATTHPAITEQPATPTPVTSRPNIDIQTVQIERPANIPAAWGEV